MRLRTPQAPGVISSPAVQNSAQKTEAGSMGRPQLGLPRLLGMKVRPRPPDNTPPTSGWAIWNDGKVSSHEKPRIEPGHGSFWSRCARKSGAGGSVFLGRDFQFGAEPIFLIVAVFAASFLVEFIGT